MTSIKTEKISALDEHIEGTLIPQIEKEFEVLRYKKVGDLYFFLVIKKKDFSTPSKMLLTYKITQGFDGEAICSEYMDSSTRWSEYSIRCPNALLNLIDKSHPTHKKFLMGCLLFQDNQKRIRTERPVKIAILKPLPENTVISSKQLGEIVFKQVVNSRKGDFKATRTNSTSEIILNVDMLEISELPSGE